MTAGQDLVRSEATASLTQQYQRNESAAHSAQLGSFVSIAGARTACTAWKITDAAGYRACGEATIADAVISTRQLPPQGDLPQTIALSQLRVEGCPGNGIKAYVARAVVGESTMYVGQIPPNSAVPLGPGSYLAFAEAGAGTGPCGAAQGAGLRLVTPADTIALGWISTLACAT